MRKSLQRYVKITALMLMLLSIKPVIAQNSGPPNDLDKNFVPDKNSIFNSAPGSNTSKSGSKGSSITGDYHNVLEINPGFLLRNMFVVGYERKLSSVISLQGGLGYVFGKDAIQQSLNLATDFSGNSGGQTSSVSFGNILSQGVFNGPNICWNVAIRFYFEGGGFYNYYSYNDFGGSRFLELGVKGYGNSLVLNNSSTSSVLLDKMSNDYLYTTVYYLNWGYHLETSGKLITTHHIYFGAGVRTTSYDAFQQIPNPTYSYPVTNTLSGQRQSVLYPVVQIGYELGFAFK
jgi:hypothetical protein